MRFSLLSIPALALLADAAAVAAPEPTEPAVLPAEPALPAIYAAAKTGGVTLKDRSSIVQSIISSMRSEYSKSHTHTSTQAATPTKKATPTTSAKASKPKRQVVASACAAQPIQYSYTPAVPVGTTDVMAPISAWLADTTLINSASSAAVPTGYSAIYSGLLGAAVNRNYYLYYTDHASYTPATCGAICKADSNCRSFTIYFQRAASLWPAAACPNPTAYTAVRCAYYNNYIAATDVTNAGQWQQNFGVVIDGANAYKRTS